MMTEEEE